MGQLILKDVLLIFLTAIPIVLVLRALHLPPLVGFILTGAIIGPSGLRLIGDAAQIEILAELGVTLLLFVVGLEFSFSSFEKTKRHVLIGGTLQILLTIAAGILVGLLLDWPFYLSLYFGCLMSLSSTAVVLGSLLEHRLHDSVQGRVATGILILQDIVMIPMLVLLPILGRSELSKNLLIGLGYDLGAVAVILVGVMLFIRYGAHRFLRFVSRVQSRELFLITILTFALGMAWITNLIGLSFALGAFLAGLMIGATDYRYEALSQITPLRFCFNTLFFVSIGMLVNLPFLAEHLPIVILLVALIPVVKMVITTGILFLLKIPLRMALIVGMILGQVGEFSFLIASVGLRNGALDAFTYQVLIASSAVTMLLTPLFVRWASPIADIFCKFPGIARVARLFQTGSPGEEIASLSHHVLICGFGPLGEAFGNMLRRHDIPTVIVELNPDTIRRARKAGEMVFYGDGTSEEILYKVGIERAKMLAITTPDFLNNAAIIKQAKRLNPEITIVTRAKNRSEVGLLYEAGAEIVVSEELEAGIEMGRYALKELGIGIGEANTFINKIRDFGSADFF